MKTITRIQLAGIFAVGLFVGYVVQSTALASDPNSVWTPERTLTVGGVGSVRVSPDGKHILFTVWETIVENAKAGGRFHTYRVNRDGSGRVELIAPEESYPSPQWSCDGKSIAFLASTTNADNLWQIASDGGKARQLTDLKTGIGDFKWSPDGKYIAFTASDESIPKEEKAIHEANDARVVDAPGKMNCLFVVSVDPDSNGKHAIRQLTGNNYTVSSFDWSSNGKDIAFEHEPDIGADKWRGADISIVHLDDGTVTSLVHSDAAEMNPLWSTDGQWIAFIKTDNPPSRLNKFRICVISPDGRKSKQLSETFDNSFGSDSELVGWSADSRSIYYTEPRGTTVGLGELPLSGSPKIISQFPGVIYGVDLNASRSCFGFHFESSSVAGEAYIGDCDHFKPIQVSFENTNLPPVAKTEVIQWKSDDGLTIEGLLTYPSGYQKGKRYPLLVVVHGGPQNVARQFYLGSMLYGLPLATFAERGYAILRPNFRGSNGYGNKFKNANRGDWGGKDFRDILAGVDHLVHLGIADDRDVGLSGWSYGGYMAAWAVTQTKRFRAVSAGALTCDLIGSHFTSAIPSWTSDYFGEDVFKNKKAYLERSPIFYVGRAVTPTLILQGENDTIAPPSQAYEFYHALKKQGCPAKMIIYPRTGHNPFEPKLRLDAMCRNLEWFDQYMLRPSD